MKVNNLEINAIYKGNFKFKSRTSQVGHLFVRFKTKTKVLTKDGYEYAEPGNFMFYNRYEAVEYISVDKSFNHDYFRFFLTNEEKDFFTVPTSVLYKFPLSEKLEHIFELLTNEFYSVSDTRDESVSLLGKLFLIHAHQYVKQEKLLEKEPRHAELNKLRIEILSSPQIDYKISDLAERVYMSPSYFQSCYKKLFGTSCINDIIAVRIKKAKYLLTSTDKTETEIAKLCGYNNVEHFIRQFKKKEGLTPSTYKKVKTMEL